MRVILFLRVTNTGGARYGLRVNLRAFSVYLTYILAPLVLPLELGHGAHLCDSWNFISDVIRTLKDRRRRINKYNASNAPIAPQPVSGVCVGHLEAPTAARWPGSLHLNLRQGVPLCLVPVLPTHKRWAVNPLTSWQSEISAIFRETREITITYISPVIQ